MKKAAENFGFAVIILLMTAAVLTFLAPRFGWSVDAVFSGSMEPELKVGAVVITRPVEAEEIKYPNYFKRRRSNQERMLSL